MDSKKTCKGFCKKFRVSKPTGKGRYESGQALCQMCTIWIDHNGCHLKDGSSATGDSVGWFCNCCNYRVRRHPRNKVYKEKFRAKQGSDISEHQEKQDMERLEMFVKKSLHMIKSSQKGAYMNDLKMLLDISQEEMSAVATRVIRADGISKKEISHQDVLQDILFMYHEPEHTKDDLDKTGEQVKTRSDQYDSTNDYQKERQHIYDQLLYSYNTSDLSRSLFMKYEQKVNDFDHKIDVVFQKQYIAFKIDGKFFAGIIPQKSKMRCDLKLHKSNLDDPRGLLRDISDIGSWTSGKSSMNMLDSDSLEYGINITRQCFEHITGKKVKVVDADKNSHGDDSDVTDSDVTDSDVTDSDVTDSDVTDSDVTDSDVTDSDVTDSDVTDSDVTDSDVTDSDVTDSDVTDSDVTDSDVTDSDVTDSDAPKEIKILAEQMANEYITNKRMINKSLQYDLTKEYIASKSIKMVIKNHPELSKSEVMNHVRSPLRLPEKLRTRNEEGLHTDPQYSLHMALFAVNHYEWDGQNDTESKVIHLAESISELIRISDSENTKNEKNNEENTVKGSLSAAMAVWIAVATLHKEHGIDAVFSNQTIMEKIEQQKLCNVSYKTISDHISGHCVANAPTTTSSVHRKIYRVKPGIYRLYRRGEYHHPTREYCKIAPMQFQLPDEYKDLRRWYDEEYCKADTS